MCFIKQDERVVTGQPRVDGPGLERSTVSTKEQPGTDLVNGAGDHTGLSGRTGPGVVAVHAAAELMAGERRVGAGDAAQRVSHRFQNTASGFL